MEQLRALRSPDQSLHRHHQRQPKPRVLTSRDPSLVGEVGYGEWTPAGRLRHPVWRGLRPDKTPADVGREFTAPSADRAEGRGFGSRDEHAAAGTGSKNGSQGVRVGDRKLFTVTNLDKVLFPETGFTKGKLIDYYARIAPAMLPHLVGRPLTMKRFPDGVEGKFFLEKNARPRTPPDWVKTLPRALGTSG